jgi:hypothetical protein
MVSEKPKSLFTARLLLIFGVFLLAGLIYIAAVALRGPDEPTGLNPGGNELESDPESQDIADRPQ